MKIQNLPTPQDFIPRLKNKIPRYILITFIASFVMCLLIHRQAYTNGLLNHDNIEGMFNSSYGVASGRWLLPYVIKLHGNWSVPWVIGVQSAFFLAMAICIVVYIMRIRSTLGCIIASALITSFPALTSTNFYMFSVSAYMLSFLVSAIGAYSVINCRRGGIITGAVFISLCAGIYQAYVSVAAGLLVAALIFDLLDGDIEAVPLFLRALGYLASLALGLAIYYIMVKITSRNTGLVAYMGVSEMGKFSVKGLLYGLKYAYIGYINFFLRLVNYMGGTPWILAPAFVLLMLAAVISAVSILRKRRFDRKRLLLLAVLVILFPLAGKLIKLMTQYTTMHVLTIYGMCLIPVAAIGITEYAMDVANIKNNISALCMWFALVGAATMSYGYTIHANEFYFQSELVEKELMSYSDRLLISVQEMEDYEKGMSIVLVGIEDMEMSAVPEFDRLWITGSFDVTRFIQSHAYDDFLRVYCGWEDPVQLGSNYLWDVPEFKAMPVYPNQGSIKVIDGNIVVKLH